MVWTRLSAKGLRGKQACPEGLQQKTAGFLSGGPSRSRVYGFVWGVGGSCFFFFFLIPRALPVTIHLSALRVPAIDWLGQLLHQRKAANQSRTLPVSLLQTAEVVTNRNSKFSQALLFPGQSREEREDSELNHRAGTSWGLHPGPYVEHWQSFPSSQVHFSLSIWLLKPIWMSVGCGKGKNQGAEMLAVTRLLYFKWWL